MTSAPHGDAAWRQLLFTLLTCGERVAPRGQGTREVLHTNLVRVDLRRPVVTTPERKLNYRFMAAEALWVQAGSNELAPLTRFMKKYANYSDDGVTLFGAYGPPIVAQLPYVVQALLADRETRQAVLTIWRQNPPATKDYPCTIAMTFSIRQDHLHQHVFMRSSDAWLGIPYDMFTFACVGLRVACEYNAHARSLTNLKPVTPGDLTISMTSSHLYDRDAEAAQAILGTPEPTPVDPVPMVPIVNGNWEQIQHAIETLRERRTPEWYDWPLWKLEGEVHRG